MMTKSKLAGFAVLLAGCVLAMACGGSSTHTVVVAPAVGGPVGVDPDVDMFYNDLAPYGEWVRVDGPGWVWSPAGVTVDWRPYQRGHWVYTDHGWTWASDEEWGWAAYHYGRWHQDASFGWVWVPGTEWGPAWVAWHEGADWVGWAPLPWQVRFKAGVGLDWGNAGVHVSIQPASWSFVETRRLIATDLHRHIVPRTRNVNLIQVTRHVTNYTYIDNRVVNQSVKIDGVRKAVGHVIPRYKVRQDDSRRKAHGARVNGEDLVIHRPEKHPARGPQRRAVPPGHDEEHHSRDGKTVDDRRNSQRPAAAERALKDADKKKQRATKPRHAHDDDAATRAPRPQRIESREKPRRAPAPEARPDNRPHRPQAASPAAPGNKAKRPQAASPAAPGSQPNSPKASSPATPGSNEKRPTTSSPAAPGNKPNSPKASTPSRPTGKPAKADVTKGKSSNKSKSKSKQADPDDEDSDDEDSDSDSDDSKKNKSKSGKSKSGGSNKEAS